MRGLPYTPTVLIRAGSPSAQADASSTRRTAAANASTSKSPTVRPKLIWKLSNPCGSSWPMTSAVRSWAGTTVPIRMSSWAFMAGIVVRPAAAGSPLGRMRS